MNELLGHVTRTGTVSDISISKMKRQGGRPRKRCEVLRSYRISIDVRVEHRDLRKTSPFELRGR